MSTRGAIGFRIDGKDKISYNHSDSYPSCLGKSFVKQARKLAKVPDLADQVRNLQLVGQGGTPTPEQLEALKKAGIKPNLNVGNQSENDWYCLLRDNQGDLIQTLKTGIMIDSESFIADSLFCEYAYIINLDDRTVEFYRGFQKAEHDFGRYGHLKEENAGGSTYWGCKLVSVFPLDKIPRNWDKGFKKEEKEDG